MKFIVSAARNPVQLLSVAMIEGLLVAAIYKAENPYLIVALIIVVILIALSFAGTLIYINIYLLHKFPQLLYSPSEYDASVQKFLFPDAKIETQALEGDEFIVDE